MWTSETFVKRANLITLRWEVQNTNLITWRLGLALYTRTVVSTLQTHVYITQADKHTYTRAHGCTNTSEHGSLDLSRTLLKRKTRLLCSFDGSALTLQSNSCNFYSRKIVCKEFTCTATKAWYTEFRTSFKFKCRSMLNTFTSQCPRIHVEHFHFPSNPNSMLSSMPSVNVIWLAHTA